MFILKAIVQIPSEGGFISYVNIKNCFMDFN